MPPASTFTVHSTDFGIDSAESFWRVTPGASGDFLTLEVRGDATLLPALKAADPSWEWTLYPPYLYVRGFPVQRSNDAPEIALARIEEDDLDDYDIALYLIEHWDVVNVQIRVDRHNLHVTGTVVFSDGPAAFEVSWTKSQ